MKIKTIIFNTHDADTFDEQINNLLGRGYQLVRRDVIPGYHLSGNDYVYHKIYAELVLPDPVPEPEQGDPVEALRCIRDFCKAMPMEKCLTPACPLHDWCHYFTEDGVSPMDWPIPGEEAGQ